MSATFAHTGRQTQSGDLTVEFGPFKCNLKEVFRRYETVDEVGSTGTYQSARNSVKQWTSLNELLTRMRRFSQQVCRLTLQLKGDYIET